MKLFIGKLLLFVLLLFAADFLSGNVLSKYHLKTKNINLQNANYGFLHYDNDDILFFGASEVSHSFISSMVTEETGLSSYNLASDGCGIYYQYPLLETVLEKHTPKVILISAYQLTLEGSDYLTRIFPYYKNNEHVKQVVDDVLPNESIKLALKGYVYNSQIIRIFDGRNDNTKGYVPLEPRSDINETQNLVELPAGEVHKIPSNIKFYFIKFLESAVSSGATVYVYVPPVLEKINIPYLNTIKSITKNSGAKLMDFSTDYSLLDRKDLFNDKIHLNHNGAKVLMDKVLAKIKNDSIY
ncbi:hypothetical protein ITJ86_06580 [Winogradskyella sp. F6397]|uniref:SGNH/GDSL hydrolase family protein n=1 Tax=Winogradskyella marina TaxID=2785530 RepID=A0ABS0EGI2_9FLAO|nr:hypothetical protein [Winogradskyella marina]MBF8149556.1 hypothetical protein [Winogradskyella marina]